MNRTDWLAMSGVALACLAPALSPADVNVLRAPIVRAPPTLAPAACAPLSPPIPELIAVPEVDRPLPPIESGDVLAPFYAKLARLLRGGADDHLRIGVYGDSNACKDFLTGEMRRWLQLRYGDAGHGFVAIGKPWDWYVPRDVEQGLWRERWTSYVVSSRPAMDPYYGHGLIAAETNLRGALAWIGTAQGDAPIGKTASDVEVFYLKRRGGGAVDVRVDGKVAATIDTRATETAPGFLRLELEDAPHKIVFDPRGGAPVRLLGATLERRGTPSFVVDNLSVGAASWRTMLREDPALDRATMARRKYGLLVLHMGTNTWTGEPRRKESMRAVLARLRAQAPDVPILVMSSPDHATDGELMARVVAPEQRALAIEAGAAFFDFHAAMGGRGAMQRFYKNKMAMNDVIHWNEAGGAYMGRRVLHALFSDFRRWLATNPDAGCAR